jgi:hypothetical protein
MGRLHETRDALICLYMVAIPLFPFISYYIAKARDLGLYELISLLLLLCGYILLHTWLVIQFVKIICEKCEYYE